MELVTLGFVLGVIAAVIIFWFVYPRKNKW